MSGKVDPGQGFTVAGALVAIFTLAKRLVTVQRFTLRLSDKKDQADLAAAHAEILRLSTALAVAQATIEVLRDRLDERDTRWNHPTKENDGTDA